MRIDAFYGPLYLVWDVSPSNRLTGVMLLVTLLLCMGAAFVRPGRITAILALCAGLLWICIGIVGAGINV